MKTNKAPENYPMQFKDKIDEHLWKEHHILGGCCSSIESMKYAVAREVAEKLTDVFIKKACEWLSNVSIEDMTYKYSSFDTSEGWYKFIEEFRKAMKGE